MQAMDDMTLLREYAARNSEAAFETLVSRRIGFVYSAALRQVRDPHLAGEITQAVFIILAQKAGRISEKAVLTGWLFKTTRFTALAQMRADAKRRRRELEVQMQSEFQSPAADEIWNQMSPLLDEALATLGEKDRQAVLLRFFENKSLAEVGNVLGTGEDTARKRVARALEKLHRHFKKRGVSSTTAIIAGEISANSVQAAPVALAKSVTAVAIAKGAAASGSTLTLIKGALKIMAWTKAKTAIVVGASVLLAAGTAATLVGQHKLHSPSPQIHIKAAFVEIPKGSDDFFNSLPSFTGILEPGSTRTLLESLGSKPGFKILSEPEVTTLSGRQTQMRTTQIITIITNSIFEETKSVGSITPQTGKMEIGPILDVVPTILANSRIQITTTASVIYFLGYADSSKLTPHYATNSAGQQISLPIILPMIQTKKATARAVLADGQTLALIFPKAEPLLFSKPDVEQWANQIRSTATEKKNGENITVVLVTIEIVDAAGKRLHPNTR
jgi:RNA polymerase sigma factor (sigma-70 family)